VSAARAADSSQVRSEDPRLVPLRKAIYASGDLTVNAFLSVLGIVYVTYFLTQIVGLRTELAGAVQLVGRAVDAFSDPLMGRISDRCRWKAGRRRPFFLLGALPFGLFFALLWVDLTGASQLQLFAYYTAIYVLGCLAMTVLSVPYLALLPEMALGYDARTSLNTWRNAGAVLGVFAAVAFRPVAQVLGGGTQGYAAAGVCFGLLLALPWLAIHRVSWERPDFQQREAQVSFREGMRILMAHRNFRRLTAMYLCGRISMDLIGAMLILYFTHYLGRTDDFEPMMFIFLLSVILALPIWLMLARRLEKATVFTLGTLWWAVMQLGLLAAQPEWPRSLVFAFAPLIAFGYAVVDMMPWAMIGEIVDEDELATGERREGLYNGFFMFIRKLGGTAAIALAMFALGALGFGQGEVQPPAAVEAIRWLGSVVPALLLVVSAWFARGYPLTRAEHTRILAELSRRGVAPAEPVPAQSGSIL
jgi:sugar (glycoside-pentoside-hexuronide) transporter